MRLDLSLCSTRVPPLEFAQRFTCYLKTQFLFGHRAPRVFTSFSISGGFTEGVPPDPIPNSEVKPFRADGTAEIPLWESRSSPDSFLTRSRQLGRVFFWPEMRVDLRQEGWAEAFAQWRKRAGFQLLERTSGFTSVADATRCGSLVQEGWISASCSRERIHSCNGSNSTRFVQ